MATASAPGPRGRTITIDDARLDELAGGTDAGPVAPVRVAFAAVHVAMDAAYARADPRAVAEHVDWEATRRIRVELGERGFGIAEAMDTAQRFEIGPGLARALIEHCGALRPPYGFVAGAGVSPDAVSNRTELVDAVVREVAFVAEHGGVPMLLPMPWLVRAGANADEYVAVYRDVVERSGVEVLVHWLGSMFAPELAGYFPGDAFERVMELDPSRVRGCKLSLLDAALELRVRRHLLARGQVVLTGDDFRFGAMMLGGDPDAPPAAPPAMTGTITLGGHSVPLGDFSHGLLGVLDATAAPVQRALQKLARGDVAAYRRIIGPCESFGRHVFEPPTRHYKAGLALVAWLNGWQDSFLLPFRAERRRSLEHHLRTAELAAAAGALLDAELAAERLRELLSTHRE